MKKEKLLERRQKKLDPDLELLHDVIYNYLSLDWNESMQKECNPNYSEERWYEYRKELLIRIYNTHKSCKKQLSLIRKFYEDN